MNPIKKTVVFLALLALVMMQSATQGQISSISNTIQKPMSTYQINAQDGFSMTESEIFTRPMPSRDVTEWINVGTNSIPYGSYNHPVDMFWNTSLSQSIYTAAEINLECSSIDQI